MIPIVKEGIEEYAEAHTTPPPEHLAALAAETNADVPAPQMMVGALEGRFLEMLVFATGARRVLELGTFTGYSSLSMAAALPPDGRIVTCDLDPVALGVARRHIAASPYADRIEIREGRAIDTITTLDGPFDLVFVDADKTSYLDYYEAVLPKLAPRGLIVADNTLGLDMDGIREFDEHVARDERTVQVVLSVRSGVSLIRLRSHGA